MQKSIKIIPLAGMLMGSFIGIVEAIWLLSTNGTPDRLSLLYAVILYGCIGAAIALVPALIHPLVGKLIPYFKQREFALGLSSSLLPMGGFILLYQVRKVVYAEQMPPLHALAGIAVGLVVVAAILLWKAPKNISSKRILSIWTSLLIAGTGFWLTEAQNRRPAAVKHEKSVTKELQGKPNVLLLMIDTLRADHVQAYGKMKIRTPNMDQLAADGVLFEQCISQASWTRPSGVSIFTGRIPSGHNTQTKASRVPEEAVLFSETLQSAGMTTAALSNNINLTATFNLNQGFDTFIYQAPAYPLWGTESVFGLTFYKVVEKVLDRLKGKGTRSVEHYYQPADVVLDDAKQFITANRDNPWLLYAHLMEPHDPYFAHPVLEQKGAQDYSGEAFGRKGNENPDPSKTEYIKDLYRQEIEFMDLELGRFFQWMKEQKLYDNTVIVLVSDHGEEFNEHGGFWHGTTLYHEVLHVPLIIKTSKSGPKNLTVPWRVRSIDIAPTITDIVGLKADPSWEGEALLTAKAIATARTPQKTKEDTTQADQNALCQQSRSHPLDRIAIAENNFEGNILSSIQFNNYKYIRANKGNPRGLAEQELFDHQQNVTESKSILGQPNAACGQSTKEVQEQLHQIMGEYLLKAQKTASAAEGGKLDATTINRMKALGYMEK